jgi:MOSC domain-containing protein YiiM
MSRGQLDAKAGENACGVGRLSGETAPACGVGQLSGEGLLALVPGQRLGSVASLNVSRKKGTRKKPLEAGEAEVVEDFGFADDAHADGNWHRQISFLAQESIQKAIDAGLSNLGYGDFAENITTVGFEPFSVPIGTRLAVGDEVEAEISQIGKVCHTRCAIYHLAGDCIFPREGIFAVVRRGGTVKVGDPITLIEWGSGTCSATPPEAIAEVEAAKAAGTL